MKRIFNLTLTIALVALAVVGCKKESLLYEGPVLGHFTADASTFYVEEADTTYNLAVGITKAADTDLTFTVRVIGDESSAEENVHYRLESNQVTIKAGEVVGNVVVYSNFESLDVPKILVLEIVAGEGNASFQQKHTLKIQQFCKFNQDDFVGTYLFTSSFFGDAWEVDAVVDPENPSALIFKDLYEDGYDVTFVYNDSDKTKISILVRDQPAWFDNDYGLVNVIGSGTFDGCDKSATVSLRHYDAAGPWGTFTETLEKID